MLGIVHPFTRALYEQDGHGHVRVTRDGKVGIFTTEGQWLDGDVSASDSRIASITPTILGWISKLFDVVPPPCDRPL